MAWLQKRPNVTIQSSLYTVSLNKTLLIVGLGNPGKEYELTRHNIGFDCLDSFVTTFEEMASFSLKKDLACHLSSGLIGDSKVIAIKPTTFMNDSGLSISKVCNFYKINPVNVIVVHDDLDIDFGQIRTRVGGSSAGHNGIKSISDSLGNQDYGRVRVGIKNSQSDKIDAADFVLQEFNKDELKQLPHLKKEVVAILSEYIYSSGHLSNETRSFLV